MRIAVAYRPGISDGRATALAAALAADGICRIAAIRIVDIHIVAGVPVERAALEPLLADGVASIAIDEAPLDGAGLVIEVTSRPGVHDPAGGTLREVVGLLADALPAAATLQTARQYRFRFEEDVDPSALAGRLADALHNPLVQQVTSIAAPAWKGGERPPESYPAVAAGRAPVVERIDVAAMDDAALARLSDRRLLALSAAELAAIRSYAADTAVRSRRQEAGIGEPLTDVEIEMLAQTWSEHCKHKIFNAVIDHTEDGRTERIVSLFDTCIRRTTAELDDGSGFLKSVFSDDSGVIRFDERTLLCFKAETHNAPSALDPYGGAITGIVGVNRDIIGTGRGAKPIFNTDVLCFAPPATPEQEVPAELMHPRRVLAGVHRGIVDGGNQSGIPVVAGAFLFDPSFVGKPLVFCGTGGVLPAEVAGEPAWQGRVRPGDLAVMVGGRIGKDGIHGATFSSLALDERSPTSAVQIGDPIVQRRVLDLLLEARDAGLFHGITDNGAGGLSSSLGEMARESGGVSIDLDAAPLKYPGLAPWEILLSESQERMSLAVPEYRIEDLRDLAADRGVELSVVGRFTDDGLVTVHAGGEVVASLDLEFLHDGVPRMRLRSEWEPPPAVRVTADRLRGAPAAEEALLALLAEPNITSKESLVRQYDHEVRAGSVVKPFCGVAADGPTDGAVVRPRYDSYRGVTVTHGICPWLSPVDPYVMAMCAVDEAVRAHVACGGDPDRMAALDNFCWPDPVESGETPDGRHKLGQLVRAAKGLRRACLAYRLPLISGKDSMKNDAFAGGRKISVLPTLLVSLIGIIPDVRRAMTTDFKRPGDRLFLVGATRDELRGSAHDRLYGGGRHGPDVRPEAARDAYRALHAAAREGCMASCHDLSDGGLAVALAECAIGGRLGARVRLERLAAPPRTSTTALLFGESPSRLLVSVPRQRRERFLALIDGLDGAEIGEVTGDRRLHASRHGRPVLRVDVERLVSAWSRGPSGTGRSEGDHTRGESEADHARGRSEARRARTVNRVRVCVLGGFGINADEELAAAFEAVGARAERVHVTELTLGREPLAAFAILAFPGGFTFGDHLGSATAMAALLRRRLRGEIDRFLDSGRLALGICNGFQILVRAGLLPAAAGRWQCQASLIHNQSGRFEDRWVRVGFEDRSPCVWTRGLSDVELPVRHGEGRLVFRGAEAQSRLEDAGHVCVRYRSSAGGPPAYPENPNGSTAAAAGLCDASGRVFGLMPHPEAFLDPVNHPRWTRSMPARADGLLLLEKGVQAATA